MSRNLLIQLGYVDSDKPAVSITLSPEPDFAEMIASMLKHKTPYSVFRVLYIMSRTALLHFDSLHKESYKESYNDDD